VDRSAEITEKAERLKVMLAAENLGGVLINAQHNFSWLTAGSTNGIDMSREPGACALLVRLDGKRFVLANRIEMARILTEELAAGGDFEPVEFSWEEEKANPTFLADRARTLLNDGNVRLGSDLSLAPDVSTVEGAIARCRYELTASEIERFRRLGTDAGQAIGGLMKSLTPGLSEREVAGRAANALAAYGIHAVVNLVAADERIGNYRHPVPTEKKWERVLMVVVCARRGGLIASLTRIVSAGPVSDDLRRRTLAAAKVNAQLLEATRPGATGGELYNVAARAYLAEGFAGEQHLHHQGGAAGYRTRDWVAHPLSEEQVHLHQAFAWNPSITGTKVEETTIVSVEGIETITSTTAWPQIAVRAGGREYLAPDVLTL
jgi:Xaa-Pro dipeptidase